MNPVTILRAYCWMRFSRWAWKRAERIEMQREIEFVPPMSPLADVYVRIAACRVAVRTEAARTYAADYAEAYQHARAGIR